MTPLSAVPAAVLAPVLLTAALPAATRPAATPAALLAATRPAATAAAVNDVHITAPAAGSTDRVRVLVDAITPRYATPRQPLGLTGRLVSTGPVVTDVTVTLRVGFRVGTRTELHQLEATPGVAAAQPGAVRVRGTLRPGHDLRFAIAGVSVAGFVLPQSGVYPMQVQVGGTLAGQPDGHLGSADTFLPYWDGGRLVRPAPTAWVWPLAVTPTQGPASPTPTLLDGSTEAALAPGGRLARLLAASTARVGGRTVPLTYALDPALPELLTVLAAGAYAEEGPAGTHTRPASAAARATLARLTAAARSAPVVALPYADADVAALVHAGRADDVGRTVRLGVFVTARTLRRLPVTGQALPTGGAADPATLDALVAAGARAVVLDPSALAVAAVERTNAPTVVALHRGATTVTALVQDADVTRLVLAGPGAAPTPRLAEQLLLAETLQAAVDQGATGAAGVRPLVVSPPRDWDPASGWARMLLTDTAGVPWLTPVTLTALERRTPAPSSARGALRYPPAAAAAELPVGGLQAGSRLAGQVSALQSIVVSTAATLPASTAPVHTRGGPAATSRPPPTPHAGPAARGGTAAPGSSSVGTRAASLTESLSATLLRSTSAALRTQPALADRLRAEVATRLAVLRGEVFVASSREVTLTSRSGKVPVTLENDLPDQTVRVTVALASPSLSRPAAVTRVLRPRDKVQVEIQVRVDSASTFPVRLELLTPHRQVLSSTPLLIRSTAYGVVAVGITAGSLGVLVLALLVRAVRRLRTLRRRTRAA